VERYDRWEILIARLPNTDGTPAPYPHPCIYLGDSRAKPGHIVVVGITSDLSRRSRYSVDMPWSKGGHSETGLSVPSIAQANWLMHIPLAVVRRVIGFTPLEQQCALNLCFERLVADRKRD
jgi:hypothetical protein